MCIHISFDKIIKYHFELRSESFQSENYNTILSHKPQWPLLFRTDFCFFLLILFLVEKILRNL